MINTLNIPSFGKFFLNKILLQLIYSFILYLISLSLSVSITFSLSLMLLSYIHISLCVCLFSNSFSLTSSFIIYLFSSLRIHLIINVRLIAYTNYCLQSVCINIWLVYELTAALIKTSHLYSIHINETEVQVLV